MNNKSYFRMSDGGSVELSPMDYEASDNEGAVLPQAPPPGEEKAELVKPEESQEDVYAHLPAHQADILKSQVLTPEIQAGAGIIYRYASRLDIFIIVVSIICAIISGAALPLMMVVFGNLQKDFQNFYYGDSNISYDQYTSEMNSHVLDFVYLAIGEFIVTYVCTVGFIYTGENITAKIRVKYLEACLRQNIGFFDKIGAGEITTRITADTNLIQEGISEKVSLSLAALATFVTAFIIGFINYWKLTLILSVTIVALMLNVSVGSSFMMKNNMESLDAYARGGSLADEVLSSVRNAVAFGTQDRLAKQYDEHLKKAEVSGYKAKRANAVMVAGMMLIFFLNYGLAFWQGSKFLVDGDISVSKILIVMMCIMMGTFNLGNVTPNVQAFSTAVAAASKVFNTIDRASPLDPLDKTGEILDLVKGHIHLDGVSHIYPSRPDVLVMDNVTLDIPAGKTTALVGASGSGKSTIIGLVERFYEPIAGRIYLDGRDISRLNLRWLRQQIALVSQEPVLFSTTIYENIRYGLIGTTYESASPRDQQDMVMSAAVKANAHDFITALPQGYDTNVGERGFLLSGGQKQRIAIARAIVSDPKVLLLDEATSALDTKSEGVVQAALDAASEGRTTITIAHRLSTIKDAHNIIVMSNGQIVEQGSHNELVERQGAYYNLVSAQSIAATSTDLTAEEEEMMEKDEEQLLRRMSTRYTPNLNRAISTRTVPDVLEQKQSLEEEPRRADVWTLLGLIVSFNAPEWKFMIIGLVFCIICGGSNPTSSLFFAKEVVALSQPLTPENRHQIKKDSDFWSSLFVMLAFVQFTFHALQGVMFAWCSERLVHRLRYRVFRTLLRQDISFFDEDNNTSGALTTFLSTETSAVAGLSGSTLGTLLMMMTTLVVSIVLSVAVGWKLSLVCIACIPVLMGCGFFRFYMLSTFQQRSKTAYAASASFASEAVSAIRTVAALTREENILHIYRDSLAVQQRVDLRSILKSSALYSASQSLLFLCFALAFWWGGRLIGTKEYDLFQFFLCFMLIIFGTESAGTIFSFAPDMGKAYNATHELKKLFDRKPAIDASSNTGIPLRSVDGAIEFRDVHFRYPTRPEQPILRGLNLRIQPGQYVALVGASGCGKSTTIALLERFYDPVSGGVFIDGQEIRDLNINDYRSHIALVSQEPTLYQGTIRENILLGTSKEASDNMLEYVCREANIYDFIVSLPDGFNTVVGSKGTLLSGGQKQRIAIARALIRNPKILLLDEATSALDSESEHVVQAALDKAAKGRTTIAVAHRLSTIQKADVIFVFNKGRVVEAGTHNDLMRRGGRYAELVNLQSLSKQD